MINCKIISIYLPTFLTEGKTNELDEKISDGNKYMKTLSETQVSLLG